MCIRDSQKGNLMVAEGKTAGDGMLAGMMTYVKGVEEIYLSNQFPI